MRLQILNEVTLFVVSFLIVKEGLELVTRVTGWPSCAG